MGDLFDPGASAAKNNANQQAAAVNNAQQAWTNAATNFNGWNSANPNPMNTTTVQKPPTTGYQPQAQQIMQAPQMAAAPQMIGQQPGTQPHQAQLPQQMRSPQQAAASAPRPSPPTVNPALVQAILGVS